jgi:hypothetical protein
MKHKEIEEHNLLIVCSLHAKENKDISQSTAQRFYISHKVNDK